eukprot:6474831-Amphidinium_carterae.1
MGDGLPPVDLGNGRSCVEVVAGRYHACAWLDDGSLKCWGSNSNGQLGYGDAETRGDEQNEMGDKLPPVDLDGATIVDLTAGNSHVCVIITGGSVKCWGSDYRGAHGLGFAGNWGDEEGEMGANMPSVDLGSGRIAVQVSS